MPISEEQKQALRQRAANAKTQSKLKPDERGMDIISVPFEDTEKGFSTDVSRETQPPYEMTTETIPGTAGATFEPLPEYGSPASEPYLRVDEEDKDIDEISWNGQQPFQDAEVGTIKSLVPLNEQAIVEGFTIPPGMDEEKVLDLSSAIYTYIGPVPLHISRYTNKWFKVLGCCVQPLEGDVINETTGEVEHIKWERPLFKLDKIDPDTGENIVAYGGGTRGLQIARHFNAISTQFGWTVGDFKRPRMFYVQMENRENAHVMYGFRHRACTDEELGK